MNRTRRMSGGRRRLVATVAISGVALLALSACDADAPSPSASGDLRTVKTVTYVNPLPSYPDFNTIGECAKAEAEKNGWTYKEVGITGSASDNQASVEQISLAVASGSDALIVVPVDLQTYTTAIKAARDEGVYVVAAGTGDPSTGQQSQAGTSGAELGTLAAQSLGAVDPEAVVGFLSAGPDQAIQADAIAAFQEEAAANFPDMVMGASQFDNGDPTKDVDILRNMLTGDQSITALYVLNGTALAPAASAVNEAGKQGEIRIIGHDVTEVSTELLETDQIYGVISQGWCDMGTKSVEAIKGLSDGEEVPEFVPTEIAFVTKESL